MPPPFHGHYQHDPAWEGLPLDAHDAGRGARYTTEDEAAWLREWWLHWPLRMLLANAALRELLDEDTDQPDK